MGTTTLIPSTCRPETKPFLLPAASSLCSVSSSGPTVKGQRMLEIVIIHQWAGDTSQRATSSEAVLWQRTQESWLKSSVGPWSL